MQTVDFKMLKATELAPAGIMDVSAPQPLVEVLRDPKHEIKDNSVQVNVDIPVMFNELVHGLFLGKPPWCMEHLHEAVEISKKYQEVADILKESTDVDGYFRFAQAAAFLKKYEAADPCDTKRAKEATLDRWFATEEVNRKNNARFAEYLQKPLTYAGDDSLLFINEVRDEIHSLLGEFPPDFSEVSKFGKFGPGVSLTHAMGELDPILKCINPSALETQLPEVLWLLNFTAMGEVIFTSRTEIRNLSKISRATKVAVAMDGIDWVNFERYATVPKNVELRRSIGVGASLATWIQQAYDGFLRQRLTCWGLDLSNQDPNRSLAFLGSLPTAGDDRPATIDLTDASSRIACGLIVLLFSKPWARLLFRQRAQYCDVGEPYGLQRMEMFSAMGNALTFSLQSLIFSAVVRVVLRTHGGKDQKWRVYGDDIIVPSSLFETVCHRLTQLGFEPNMRKSFAKGYFRESCGRDYLLGDNVRPLFIKKPITDVSEVYKVMNLIALYAAEAPIPVWCYRRVWKYLLSTVPNDFRIFGEPSEVLDGYIWAPAKLWPRKMLGRVSPTETPDEYWSYLRTLLVRRSGDSHVRDTKRGRREPIIINGRWFSRPQVRVGGSRPGIALPGSQWRWLRVLRLDTRRLERLREELLQLFV